MFQTANLIVPLKCSAELKEAFLTRCLTIDNTKKSINLNIKLLHDISIKSKSSYQVPFLTTFEGKAVFLYKKKQMALFGDKMDTYFTRVIQICSTNFKTNEQFHMYLCLFQNLLMTKWECQRDDSVL